eukprot:1159868-Pelagomonas_calceolata.AAC.8
MPFPILHAASRGMKKAKPSEACSEAVNFHTILYSSCRKQRDEKGNANEAVGFQGSVQKVAVGGTCQQLWLRSSENCGCCFGTNARTLKARISNEHPKARVSNEFQMSIPRQEFQLSIPRTATVGPHQQLTKASFVP